MIDDITLYFGMDSLVERPPEDLRYIEWDYDDGLLEYRLSMDTVLKHFAVSGDKEYPFGFESAYELVVPFDRVTIETEKRFYGSQEILVFRKDYPMYENFKTLMIIRWPNQKLSVWPNNIEVAKAVDAEIEGKN